MLATTMVFVEKDFLAGIIVTNGGVGSRHNAKRIHVAKPD